MQNSLFYRITAKKIVVSRVQPGIPHARRLGSINVNRPRLWRRGAYERLKQGMRWRELKPGDPLVPKRPGTTTGRVIHVDGGLCDGFLR